MSQEKSNFLPFDQLFFHNPCCPDLKKEVYIHEKGKSNVAKAIQYSKQHRIAGNTIHPKIN
jgi:hypothetical protein